MLITKTPKEKAELAFSIFVVKLNDFCIRASELPIAACLLNTMGTCKTNAMQIELHSLNWCTQGLDNDSAVPRAPVIKIKF